MRTQKATLTLEELIKTIGDAHMQTYSPRAPAELSYIVVIGDRKRLELEEFCLGISWLTCIASCKALHHSSIAPPLLPDCIFSAM